MKIKLVIFDKLKTYLSLSILLLFYTQNSIAQEKNTITGTVIDAIDKLPIPGANVVEKGTSNGVSTDVTGKFNIKANKTNGILQVSFIGYTTKEYKLTGENNVVIEISSDVQKLKDVVVVGYGTVKKNDLTGTVNTISSKDLTSRNTTNVLEAIQGNVPGVQISSNSGRLGDGFKMLIRGKNSIVSDGNPLFVVDGTFMDDISFLNPQDIERIDILKDASSAAIYGSRGSNGVIIITTKSGSSSKKSFNINLETSLGIKEVARLPELMDGEKWYYYHQSAFLATVNGGNYATTTPTQIATAVGGPNNPVFLQRVANNDTFNWYDAILKSGIQQNNYLNITGRTEGGISYNLGLGIQNETGHIDKESLHKYTLKTGLTHKVSEKFTTGANLTITKTEEELGSDVAMRDAFRLNPFLSPYAIDASGNEIVGQLTNVPGKLFYPNGNAAIDKTSTYNPLLEIQNTKDEINKWRLIGNIFFQYTPKDWISFKTAYSGNYFMSKRGRAWGAKTNVGVANQNLPSSSLLNNDGYNQTWDNQINIKKNFKKHNFNLLALQSINSNVFETSNLSSRFQPFDTDYYNNGSGPQSTYNLGSAYTKKTLSSYALRLNYALDNKYLVTLSNRWDGSSVLSKGNKWGSFPSAALAWKINEESFLNDSKTINSLKTRISYGFTGNDNVNAYTTMSGLNLQTFYDFNNTTSNGWLPATLANKNLTWEKTRELNFGLDFGLFNNRITGTVDVYDRLSKDLIFSQKLPLETGWGTTISNVGSVSNKGLEILLTTKLIENEKVSWETTFAFSKNKNRLESIYNQNKISDIGNNLHLGYSLNSYYNYVFDGIWQESERAEALTYGQTPGQAKVKDLNNDGKIDAQNDRKIVGNSDPDWIGSINSTLKVKNFDMTISAFTNQGVLAYSQFHENFTDMQDRGRQRLNIDNWYIPQNGAGIPAQNSNSYPMPRNEGTYWNVAGNNQNQKMGYYRDASFIKVKNISVGYNFSDDLNSKLKIKSGRIYVNVLNPFVFTKYEGYDPEWATASFSIARVSSITTQLGLSFNF
jgi:TonB-dependent starch-binding outer membrane protein SusC